VIVVTIRCLTLLRQRRRIRNRCWQLLVLPLFTRPAAPRPATSASHPRRNRCAPFFSGARASVARASVSSMSKSAARAKTAFGKYHPLRAKKQAHAR
jgi:hypothetical protein